MVSNRITEGVGKKIVEALKQQSDIEIQSVVENPADEDSLPNNSSDIEFVHEDQDNNSSEYNNQEDLNLHFDNGIENQAQYNVNDTMTFTPSSTIGDSDLDNFEIPTNIAVLKQLITQLPAGVSKQTGAQIIRQTMEALGISMKNVLQEAQQVQESLNNSSRECQASIMEYKKQIGLLERQSQKFQKQYTALNDIISLFIQTNI